MNKRYFPATSNTLTDEMDDLIKALATSDLDLDPAERKQVQKDRVMTLLTEKIESAVQRADKCQEHEDRVYQARLRASVLPYEAVLEKVQRYETRLQRQLTRAMTDLERIQAARKSREAESGESAEMDEMDDIGDLCQTNPFTPPPVRVPPSGGLGAMPSTAAQTNLSTADLAPAQVPAVPLVPSVPEPPSAKRTHLVAHSNSGTSNQTPSTSDSQPSTNNSQLPEPQRKPQLPLMFE